MGRDAKEINVSSWWEFAFIWSSPHLPFTGCLAEGSPRASAPPPPPSIPWGRDLARLFSFRFLFRWTASMCYVQTTTCGNPEKAAKQKRGNLLEVASRGFRGQWGGAELLSALEIWVGFRECQAACPCLPPHTPGNHRKPFWPLPPVNFLSSLAPKTRHSYVIKDTKINPEGEDSSSRISLCPETAAWNSRLSKDVKITGSVSFIVCLFVWAPHGASAIDRLPATVKAWGFRLKIYSCLQRLKPVVNPLLTFLSFKTLTFFGNTHTKVYNPWTI